MSNRYHNKWHRVNHHSFRDPSIPDSGYDPIASREHPFKGEFVLSGQLSAFSPSDFYSVVTNNILADYADLNTIHSFQITADQLDVNYIDIKYYESTGFYLTGTGLQGDYINIPDSPWTYDMVLLDQVGLSSNTWASFVGSIKTNNNLYVSGTIYTSNLAVDTLTANHIENTIGYTTIDNVSTHNLSADNFTLGVLNVSQINVGDVTISGCLSAECLDSNSGTTNVYTNLNMNNSNINNVQNIDGQTAIFTDIWGTNFHGITSTNLGISVREGWKLGITTTYTPRFTAWQETIDSNTNYPTNSADMMIIVRVASNNYRSYGEVAGIAGGNTVALAKVGNFGLLPNANVEHALSAGLWIDNEQTFTFIAPSGQAWSVNTLSGYYEDPYTSDANTIIYITTHQQNTREFSFTGDTLQIQNMILNGCLSTNCIDFTNATLIDSTVSTLTASQYFMTLVVNGSSVAIPLYNY